MKIVDKNREIYYIENVKFHIDNVKGLGDFFEIEAIDQTGHTGREKLQEQCNYYLKMCGIEEEDLLTGSYSDMVIASA
jgi:predicted adenylyl cyclase CyaB